MSPAKPPRPPAPEVDLAFRIGTAAEEVLPPGLEGLLAAGGALTAPTAEAPWQELLGRWLAELMPELPPQLAAPAYSLGLLLTDDASIAALNGQWRHRPEATDVLAFAAQDAADTGLAPPSGGPEPTDAGFGWDPGDGEALELGDIVISLETAARQAPDNAHDLAGELLFLASHGLLHLLGWDHPDNASLTAMLARQEELIAALRSGADPAGEWQ